MEKLTTEQISDSLKRTGFIFEQRVATIIEQEGFLVSTNRSYLDPDENKSREIDIIAHKKVFEIEEYNISVICYLICECKDTTTPFVFFTRTKMWGDEYYHPREIQLLHENYFNESNGKTSTLNGFYFMELEKHFTYTKSNKKAVQVCKIIRNGKKIEAQSTGIVDKLLIPMAKAYLYNSKNAPKSSQERRYCKLFYNLVVVESEIYTVDTEENNITPVSVGFIPFLKDIKLREVDGTFVTFFVTAQYLSQFLKEEVFAFAEIVYKKYAENKRFIIGPKLQDL